MGYVSVPRKLEEKVTTGKDGEMENGKRTGNELCVPFNVLKAQLQYVFHIKTLKYNVTLWLPQ